MTTSPGKTGQDLRDPARQDLERPDDKTRRDARKLRDEAEHRKATQFDGNPNVRRAPDGPLGPKDDTPWKLEKKE